MKSLIIIVLLLFFSSCNPMIFIGSFKRDINIRVEEDLKSDAQTEILKFQTDTIRRE